MILSWMVYSLVIALLCALAARVLEHSVRQRGWPIRALWVGAMAASLLLPVVPRLLPDRAPAAPSGPETADPAPAARPSVSALPAEILVRASSENLPRSVSPDRLFGGLWMAGSAAVLAFLLASAWALGRRRRGWRTATVDGREVLVSPDTGPAVVGLLRSRIVVPEWALAAKPGTRSLLLAHEEEHIRAHDPRLLLGALMAAVALPWNAALWWQLRRLRLAIEVDCDLRVLGRGADPRTYSRLLVDVGERGQGTRVAVLALSESFSSLERRIRLMLTSRSRGWWLRAAGSVGFATVLLATACMEPRPTSPKPAGGGGGGACGGRAGAAGLGREPGDATRPQHEPGSRPQRSPAAGPERAHGEGRRGAGARLAPARKRWKGGEECRVQETPDRRLGAHGSRSARALPWGGDELVRGSGCYRLSTR